jgi:hypothetical protein
MEHIGTDLFADLQRFIESCGVRVLLREMDLETPGEFDGLTITINPRHDPAAASFYLAHSFGSIVQWSTDTRGAQEVFDDLRHAKPVRQQEPARFEQAVARYREFEQRSSQHAVWMLAEIGHRDVIDPYTRFFRADIEVMTIFHRTGKAPRWPEFYADWQRKIERGEVRIEPFTRAPIPPFQPVRIEQQEVLQERD